MYPRQCLIAVLSVCMFVTGVIPYVPATVLGEVPPQGLESGIHTTEKPSEDDKASQVVGVGYGQHRANTT